MARQRLGHAQRDGRLRRPQRVAGSGRRRRARRTGGRLAVRHHDAQVALGEFNTWAHTCGVPETARLARTVRRWEAEILAWHRTGGASNGPTEAVNLLIKKVQRTGHGFGNFDNYRTRLLLHCGVDWQDQPAARLRRRQPRSAA